MIFETQRKFLGIIPVSRKKELKQGQSLDLHRIKYALYQHSDKVLEVVKDGVDVTESHIRPTFPMTIEISFLKRTEYRDSSVIDSTHFQTPFDLALTRLVVSCRE